MVAQNQTQNELPGSAEYVTLREAAQIATTVEERARLFAQSHRLEMKGKYGFDFLKRLEAVRAILYQGYQSYRQAAQVEVKTSYVAEWMLDNYYLIEQSVRQIREDMPRGYYQQLPKIHSQLFGIIPRIYAFVLIFLESCQGQVDADHLERFVNAYQEVSPLKIAELWALPVMLRYGTLQNLASIVAQTCQIKLSTDMQAFLSEQVSCPWGDESVVSFCFLSLRSISAIDWKIFVESVNRIDVVLNNDPAGVYFKMDFQTRDCYRGLIENIASRTRQAEEEIARQVEQLASSDASVSSRPSPQDHVGYYLVDAGRPILDECVGYSPGVGEGLKRMLLKHPAPIYIGMIFLLATSLLVIGNMLLIARGVAAWQAGLFILLALLPAWSMAVGLVNWLITRLLPPRMLPKMDFDHLDPPGIPPTCPTLIAIPCLLADHEEVESLLQQLEMHFLGNSDPFLHYVLLSDFTDAPQQHLPTDQALLEHAMQGVTALNQKYPRHDNPPFLLLHRERLWNPSENCWMSWERKRGKLEQLNQFLLGHSDDFPYKAGDVHLLHATRYVITLDADTTLPRGTARQLIATLVHPLNQARFDESGRLVSGYTILQPRIQTSPRAVNGSLFTQVWAGESGLDPYTHAISDVYQDLFGEGVYVGKGIYDLQAFERALARRVPENTLLSHDLFEGIHGRAGLVTDIAIFEDHPSHYIVNAYRHHRWIRGDWQIMPWLFPRTPRRNGPFAPNDLSAIDRWKILDNLRRSIFPISLMVMLVSGWLTFQDPPFFWLVAGILALGTPVVTGILARTTRRKRDRLYRKRDALIISFYQTLLALIFLPYEALVSLDAILAALHRMYISHKRLLQWRTTSHTIRLFGAGSRIGLVWSQMYAPVILSLAIAAAIIGINPGAFNSAAPFLLAWLVSPFITEWISRPLDSKKEQLRPEQIRQLRRLACRTWGFFEHYVDPVGNWLPPDHFQEQPRGLVVRHTSPTNIGLLLISTLAAHDLGYIGHLGLSLRLMFALQTMQSLPRYHGHFLNWYDSSTLQPLYPRYISTVDSGNLAGCLLTLAQGLSDVASKPLLQFQSWLGLIDVLDVMEECIEHSELTAPDLRAQLHHMQSLIQEVPGTPHAWLDLVSRLRSQELGAFGRLLVEAIEANPRTLSPTCLTALRHWAERINYHLDSLGKETAILAPWLGLLQPPPCPTPEIAHMVEQNIAGLSLILHPNLSLQQVPDACRRAEQVIDALAARLQELEANHPPGESQPDNNQVLRWRHDFRTALQDSRLNITDLLADLESLKADATRLFDEMDFSFLFQPHRQLFHIGYNLDTERLDDHYYDLFASESRLASYLAIAKDDVPQSHWLHLARPLTRLDGTLALLSWSGTMFEYLMPNLFMQNGPGSLLEQSCRAAIRWQVAYGRQMHTPWGISEAGYYHFDTNQNYQYRAFGAPGLGFKRGLADDLVIAPYASILALPYEPLATLTNIETLGKLGAMGCYGYYESLDFTPSRLGAGEKYQVVQSYYAHHQGMILLALDNFLHQDIMVQRFHSHPGIYSAELLLYEFVPRSAPLEKPQPDKAPITHLLSIPGEMKPWEPAQDAPLPQIHLLSNGRYKTLITHHGGGFSNWEGKMLTRWRADTTLDNWGTWLYLHDQDRGLTWSATQQPTGSAPENYQVEFYHAKASFQRQDHGITTRLKVCTAPDDDLEVRLLSLSNHTDDERHLRVASYAEVVMATMEADRRHPAFNKLFVENQVENGQQIIIYRRRPRASDEPAFYLGHLLVTPAEMGTGFVITSRRDFLGRGGDPHAPACLSMPAGEITRLQGNDLDPIMCCGIDLCLPAHRTMRLAFITAAANTRDRLIGAGQEYQNWAKIERTFNQASTFSQQMLEKLEMDTDDLADAQRLLSILLYPHRCLRPPAEVLASNRLGQPGLWKYAISGDYPIVLAHIGNEEESSLLLELLKAHAYWRNYDLQIDLVLVNDGDTGYTSDLQHHLYHLLQKTGAELWLNRRGGIFLLRGESISGEDGALMESVARAVLYGNRGSLHQQLEKLPPESPVLPHFVPTFPNLLPEPLPPVERPGNLQFDNGWGGFTPDGREYVIYLEPGKPTPAPWINVIANPTFGFTISESGSGFTWALNSGENRLTPWRNDPLLDPPSEAFYLRDEETGRFWSPTPLPAGGGAPYLVRHGAGYTIFQNHSHGYRQQLRYFAMPDAPLKVMQLRLENATSRLRRLSVVCYVEWALGTQHETMQPYILSEFDAAHNALLAFNAYNTEFGKRVAFLTSTREPTGLTTDREEFLGRMGSYQRPAALLRVGLTGRVEAGADPCAALQALLWIAPGETKEVTFLLGQGADRDETLALLEKYRSISAIEQGWQELNTRWQTLLDAVRIQTPDPAMNLILNRWLLYQALACRIWGRSALYQSSGAFGFRDQLQDALGLLHAAPEIARKHILEAASHQFEEGDVLHWWHPPSGRGVRTRCSDNLVWLPYVTAGYVQHTGDRAILDEPVDYLHGEALADGEQERYAQFSSVTSGSRKQRSLFEHCRRAIKRGATSGAHGLPLIGSHDWNDGYNRVGWQGAGESVWNAWFLYDTLKRFARLCEATGHPEAAISYHQQARQLQEKAEEHAWDGGWYLRAFYDDGEPLGSAQSSENQIDSLAQSWAALSGAAGEPHARQAMQAVDQMLVRRDAGLVKLFSPPFDKTRRDPGYIKGYPPGVRENGGQYTHAATWVGWAFAALGDGKRAYEIFNLLNPIRHSDTPRKAGLYRVEPYVIAADVYSVPPYTGRGGWSWYTGSAGWMYRLGLEAILGLRRQGASLIIDPCIPSTWESFEVCYTYREGIYHIRVENPAAVEHGVRRCQLDGENCQANSIPLSPDPVEHQVLVEMG